MKAKEKNRIIANLSSAIDIESSIGETVQYGKKRKVKKVMYRRELSNKSYIKDPKLKNIKFTAEATPWVMDRFADFFIKD